MMMTREREAEGLPGPGAQRPLQPNQAGLMALPIRQVPSPAAPPPSSLRSAGTASGRVSRLSRVQSNVAGAVSSYVHPTWLIQRSNSNSKGGQQLNNAGGEPPQPQPLPAAPSFAPQSVLKRVRSTSERLWAPAAFDTISDDVAEGEEDDEFLDNNASGSKNARNKKVGLICFKNASVLPWKNSRVLNDPPMEPCVRWVI